MSYRMGTGMRGMPRTPQKAPVMGFSCAKCGSAVIDKGPCPECGETRVEVCF